MSFLDTVRGTTPKADPAALFAGPTTAPAQVAPAATPARSTPKAAMNAMFAAPATSAARTPHHGYELPAETREYRPKYVQGKYQLPGLDGKGTLKAPRVTSGVKALDDTTGLQKWLVRQTVAGLAEDTAPLSFIDPAADTRDLNRVLDDVAERAQVNAGAKRGAELGTAIHAWLEAVERGLVTLAEVPELFKPYATAYFGALEAAGIHPVPELVERIVYDEVTGWAGTFDNVFELANGELVIGDKKSSKVSSFRYGLLSFAQQMAVYARATHMLDTDGKTWVDMPPVGDAFAVIAHVPSDKPGACSLHTIDLEYGRQAVDLAEAVRAARTGAGAGVPDRWKLPTVIDAINETRSTDELAELYERHSTIWSPELTAHGQRHAATFAE